VLLCARLLSTATSMLPVSGLKTLEACGRFTVFAALSYRNSLNSRTPPISAWDAASSMSFLHALRNFVGGFLSSEIHSGELSALTWPC